MCLPKIYILSTFPVFQLYWYFDGQTMSSVITLVLTVKIFCETYQKSYRKAKIYKHTKKSAIFLTFQTFNSTCQKHTQNRPRMLRSQDKPSFVFWPFLVRFRLNLGLNHLKCVHKSISAVNSIQLIRFNSSDLIRCNSIQASQFDAIQSILLI